MTTADERQTFNEIALDLSHPVLDQRRPQTPWVGARPLWERRYAASLPLLDLLMLSAALAVARLGRVQLLGRHHAETSELVVAGCVVAWVAAFAACGAYESRQLGEGAEEYKRVFTATGRYVAALAIGAFAFDLPVSRGFLIAAVPLGLAFVLAGRHSARLYVSRLRRHGQALRRVLVVGPALAAAEAARQLVSDDSGFMVVGTCAQGLVSDGMTRDTGPYVFDDVLGSVRRSGADTVAIVGTADMPTGFVKELSWQLEGTGVDLMISPALTDVAGPRVHVRPVARLAMLYLEEPQLRGAARVVKACTDRTLAALLLAALLPALLVIAAVVKITSPGEIFFRQRRAGLHGEYFGIWKFRTMRVNADQLSHHYDLTAELDALGTKQADDPRVTGVGRFLRATSLDELPQLINVLLGHMSLVGPRPLRQHEIETFGDVELRRHLVKPGMTGLWQVSGRSDIGWEERLRLDLYYVENWSPWLDLAILMRTIGAVLRRSGAY